jgi:hypothetical protein
MRRVLAVDFSLCATLCLLSVILLKLRRRDIEQAPDGGTGVMAPATRSRRGICCGRGKANQPAGMFTFIKRPQRN